MKRFTVWTFKRIRYITAVDITEGHICTSFQHDICDKNGFCSIVGDAEHQIRPVIKCSLSDNLILFIDIIHPDCPLENAEKHTCGDCFDWKKRAEGVENGWTGCFMNFDEIEGFPRQKLKSDPACKVFKPKDRELFVEEKPGWGEKA